MEEREGSLKDEIRRLNQSVQEALIKKKSKKFRLPFSAKVGKAKLKKGYITVQQINENKNIKFTREPIVDGTIRLDDTYHAVRAKDLLEYKGKPLIIIAKNKINPYNPIDDTHETYGQKYIMARMQTEMIKPKKSMGNIIWIIFILLIIGVAAYYFLGGAK